MLFRTAKLSAVIHDLMVDTRLVAAYTYLRKLNKLYRSWHWRNARRQQNEETELENGSGRLCKGMVIVMGSWKARHSLAESDRKQDSS